MLLSCLLVATPALRLVPQASTLLASPVAASSAARSASPVMSMTHDYYTGGLREDARYRLGYNAGYMPSYGGYGYGYPGNYYEGRGMNGPYSGVYGGNYGMRMGYGGYYGGNGYGTYGGIGPMAQGYGNTWHNGGNYYGSFSPYDLYGASERQMARGLPYY